MLALLLRKPKKKKAAPYRYRLAHPTHLNCSGTIKSPGKSEALLKPQLCWRPPDVECFPRCTACHAINAQCGRAEFKQWTFGAGNTRLMLMELEKRDEASFRVTQDNENMLYLALAFSSSVGDCSPDLTPFYLGLYSKARVTEFTHPLRS